MLKKTLLIASVGAILSSGLVFANGSSNQPAKDQAIQYKQTREQNKQDFKQKRDEIKKEFQDAKQKHEEEHKKDKKDSKDGLKSFFSALNTETLALIKEQNQAMKVEIDTVRQNYQSGSVSAGEFAQMQQEIQDIRTKYNDAIKSLLPVDMQDEYQTLVDKLNTEHDQYASEITARKDALVTNRNNAFGANTQNIQNKYENYLMPRLDALKQKNPTTYQKFIDKITTLINKKIASINKMKNITASAKQTRLDLYNAMLQAIENTSANIEATDVIASDPVSEVLDEVTTDTTATDTIDSVDTTSTVSSTSTTGDNENDSENNNENENDD